MAVTGSDIHLLLSGDSGNTDPAFSLGGGKSADEVDVSPILNNLFDNVSAAEAAAGAIEYRCVYVKNNHATDTVTSLKIWLSANTPSPGTTIEMGLDPAGKNATAFGPISPSSMAPTGVVFSAPSTEGAGLSIGTLQAKDVYPVWFKRTVTAGAAALNGDGFTLAYAGTPL